MSNVMFSRDELVKMSVESLQSMQLLIGSVIHEKEQAKLDAFRKEIAARAVKAGIDLNAFLAVQSGSKAAPKYRHPTNPTVTWSGRGREPDWIKGKTEAQRKAMLVNPEPAASGEAPKAA